MADLKLWAFTLTAAEGDDASTTVLGLLECAGPESFAFMRATMMFVSVSANASDVAAREFGGHWRDYPTAFFSIREADEGEQETWLEEQSNKILEVNADYPYLAEGW